MIKDITVRVGKGLVIFKTLKLVHYVCHIDSFTFSGEYRSYYWKLKLCRPKNISLLCNMTQFWETNVLHLWLSFYCDMSIMNKFLMYNWIEVIHHISQINRYIGSPILSAICVIVNILIIQNYWCFKQKVPIHLTDYYQRFK